LRFRSLIAGELSVGDWQPIETAPKDGRDVLVAYRDRTGHIGMTVGYYADLDGSWSLPDWGYTIPDPIAWRPLPEPPQGA
jgi:hypothetical protein